MQHESKTMPRRPSVTRLLTPHTVHITKSETGFGFNVRGQVNEGGTLKSINGELYAPLQHVSAVLEGGAAQSAGILKGDRILEVNNANVEGATHKQVVDLIKSCGDSLSLTVISVSAEEADRLEPSGDNSIPPCVDYSEKRSLPISVPEYKFLERNGERFVVYSIHMAGRHLCCRRYSEFTMLHNTLKRDYLGCNFPKLPGKWPFVLTDQQLDARRRGLEFYLEKVCAIRVIAESNVMRDFLTETEDEIGCLPLVDLKVMLPTKEVVTVQVQRNDTTSTVHKLVMKTTNVREDNYDLFAIFEMVEHHFERKVADQEFPYALYIANFSTATATCLVVKRWFFDVTRLDVANEDLTTMEFLFRQAIEDVNRGTIRTDGQLCKLKAFQDTGQKHQYLELAKQLEGYGSIVFPYCPCDARKQGQVIPMLSYACLKLQACTNDGTAEDQVIEFSWSSIAHYELNEESRSFAFQYKSDNKPVKQITIFSNYGPFLFECFNRIKEEMCQYEC